MLLVFRSPRFALRIWFCSFVKIFSLLFYLSRSVLRFLLLINTNTHTYIYFIYFNKYTQTWDFMCIFKCIYILFINLWKWTHKVDQVAFNYIPLFFFNFVNLYKNKTMRRRFWWKGKQKNNRWWKCSESELFISPFWFSLSFRKFNSLLLYLSNFPCVYLSNFLHFFDLHFAVAVPPIAPHRTFEIYANLMDH